jgi:hypothetical protein
MDDDTTDCGALGEVVVFRNHFKRLSDSHQRGKDTYPLDEILLLALLAVLAGAESFVDIARFDCKKLALLRSRNIADGRGGKGTAAVVRGAAADVPGNPVADRPAAGAARASMMERRGQMRWTTMPEVRLDARREQRCSSPASRFDLRAGFDGLAAKVQQIIGADPFSGHVFIFRSKRGQFEAS